MATHNHETIHPEVRLEDFPVRVKRTQVLIVVTLALAGIIGYLVFLSWSRHQKIERFRRAYEAIKVGDSREAVVSGMGEPEAVTDCPEVPFSDKKKEAEFRSKCFQQYKYVRLMAVYTISFDRSGAVFNKSKIVSP